MDGGFGTPFLGQAADALVDGFVEAEKVADYAAVQQGAVGEKAITSVQQI